MVRVVPRSSFSQAPSPFPDQRVARLLSTALAGTLPSFVLAVTAEPAGVISTNAGVAVGGGVRVATGVGVGVGLGVGVAVGDGVGVTVGTGVGVRVGVGVGVGATAVEAKMLISVTLLKLFTVFMCPT